MIWTPTIYFLGFQGRPNKQDDTCYTFWIGAALRLLSPDTALVTAQLDHCIPYILSTQDGITGGLAKWPNQSPDPLHTYLGLAGMALGSSISAELEPVDPALNITLRAKNYLDSIYDDDKKTK
jgi:geranylgeranyl transferase type-1 subunit beta